MATETGKPVAHCRVARRRIGDDVYRGFIQTESGGVDHVICLQAVWKIEHGFTAIVRERERVGKDVLRADTAGKVVALPVGAVSGGMAFHHAIVVGHTGIVESRSPDANPGGVGQIARHIHLQPRLQFSFRQRQRKQVVVERRAGRLCDKPVDMDRRYIALHLCLQPSELCPQRGVFGRVKRDVIGIFLLHPRPTVIDIPLVMPQVDVEDSRLRVDGVGLMIVAPHDRLLTNL